ncbi:MAG: hypothetical protein ACOC5S_00990 [Acidobacteriota bacterium]
MEFYFVKDFKKRYRFFSSPVVRETQVNFTKWQKMWEEAKKRLLLLPPRILGQEQAFERGLKLKDSKTIIYHSGRQDKDRIRKKFTFFLLKQRSKHIALLVAETLLLPITGLMAFLPGPNIFFYVLFLILYIQWRAFRGIKILLHKNHEFVYSPLLGEWEAAVKSQDPERMKEVIKKIDQKLSIHKIQKILYK